MRKYILMFIIFLLYNNLIAEEMQNAIHENSIEYLVIYYHSFDYPDIGRSVQNLKTQSYEWKYLISYKEACGIIDKSFFNNNYEIYDDEKKQTFKKFYSAQILIELYNKNNEMISWYSFDESDREFILFNANLIRINEGSFRQLEALIEFVKNKRTK